MVTEVLSHEVTYGCQSLWVAMGFSFLFMRPDSLFTVIKEISSHVFGSCHMLNPKDSALPRGPLQ